MKHEAVATSEATDSALATTLTSAAALVARFPECFWFWRPDARLLTFDDVRLVVQDLRKYGNRAACAPVKRTSRVCDARSST